MLFRLAEALFDGLQLDLVEPLQVIQWTAIGILSAKSLTEWILDQLNAKYIRQNADAVPKEFEGVMSDAVYTKSVKYSLAKSRLSLWNNPYDLIILLIALFSGFLSWSHSFLFGVLGSSVWAGASYVVGISIVLSLASAPWDWYSQFRLEERFGFNKSTLGLWVMDRVKGIMLGLLLGVPLVALLLKLVQIGGAWWWAYAWMTVLVFQVLMMIVAPMWILPLFNKLEPLAEGELRDRLLTLGERTGFSASTILVMDGSKRSAHSNAFFTGFGRFRKIVLFDTLIDQLSMSELEAVLAHEIGLYKKKHVLKMLAWSTFSLLVSFWVLSVLMNFLPFFEAFGFKGGPSGEVAFLLFGLLSGAVTFWRFFHIPSGMDGW